jgi:hypothetical protein
MALGTAWTGRYCSILNRAIIEGLVVPKIYAAHAMSHSPQPPASHPFPHTAACRHLPTLSFLNERKIHPCRHPLEPPGDSGGNVRTGAPPLAVTWGAVQLAQATARRPGDVCTSSIAQLVNAVLGNTATLLPAVWGCPIGRAAVVGRTAKARARMRSGRASSSHCAG